MTDTADPAGTPPAPRRNWSGTHTYRAAGLRRPRSVDELAALIRSTPRIRALGTRHCFNDLADTDGDQISVAGLPARIDIDTGAAAGADTGTGTGPGYGTGHGTAAGTATVSAGQSYAEIGPTLHAAGFGLPALASLPHVSVAGACATATHGSGRGIGNLATQVSGVEFVDGTGELRRWSRSDHPRAFSGAVVALGAFGVVTAMTLDLVPTFEVAQRVYRHLPAEAWLDRFAEIAGAAYSVSCFTSWIDEVDQIWVKVRVGDPDPDPAVLAGAQAAEADLHPVPGGDPTDCTPQRGVPGPWFERLPHFAAGRTPSFGDEIQSEFFVPAEQAPEAARALFGVGHRIAPALRISEVRTIAADQAWLSHALGRDVVGFHFTWTSDQAAVRPALELVERALLPFDPVPHWGKVFTGLTGPRGVDDPRYPMLGAFAELAARHDPDRRFVNDYLTRWHLR